MEESLNKEKVCNHPLVQDLYNFLSYKSPSVCKRIFTAPKQILSSSIICMVVTETLEWIDNNLPQAMSAESIALKSGYSRWHFQREFKKITGLSLNDFIRLRRVIAASNAISNADAPLCEIAPDYGFTNELCLLRAFRKYLHTTPNMLRSCE